LLGKGRRGWARISAAKNVARQRVFCKRSWATKRRITSRDGSSWMRVKTALVYDHEHWLLEIRVVFARQGLISWK